MMQKPADIDFNDNCSANSDDQLNGKTSKASDLIPPVVSDQPSSNITICGFCQSARVSEVKESFIWQILYSKIGFVIYEVLLNLLYQYLLGHWRNAALLKGKTGGWR